MNKHFFATLLCCFLILGSSGCLPQKIASQPEEYNLKKIAVVPVDLITPENGSSPSKSLHKGAQVLDKALADYLSASRTVVFLSSEQQDTLLGEYNGNQLLQAIHIGKKIGADAILTSRLNRYQERSGQEYAVEQPASIAFEYRLTLVETGQSLCAGVFDETQQAISDNLLSLQKIFRRKGKWITVQELAREGVRTKLGSCRFLSQSK